MVRVVGVGMDAEPVSEVVAQAQGPVVLGQWQAAVSDVDVEAGGLPDRMVAGAEDGVAVNGSDCAIPGQGYGVYLVLRKLGASFWVSAGLAGLVGDLLTYVTTAFQLALSLQPDAVLAQTTFFTAEFSVIQIPIAILEFAFTAATVQYIASHRPEILGWWRKQERQDREIRPQIPVRRQTVKLDKFTKYALITMFAIVAGIIVSTYIGF